MNLFQKAHHIKIVKPTLIANYQKYIQINIFGHQTIGLIF